MAKHLARIHGTEEDKVNCPFYFKIGACRHADRCSRIHHRPAFSQTILIKHIYNHPIREAELNLLASGQDRTTASANIINLKPTTSDNHANHNNGNGNSNSNNHNNDPSDPTFDIDPKKSVEDFLVFFEDFYTELSKFGQLECLHICDNLGDHMVGHVYAKFSDEEEASDALNILNGRYYNGKKMEVEFSPVTDFREARCRDFDEDTCSRGGFCNFMHVKPVPPCLLRDIDKECEEDRRMVEEEEERRKEKRDRERRKKRKHKDRNRDRERSDRDRGDRSDRDRERSDRGDRSDRDRDRDRGDRSDRDRDRERRREKKRSRRSDSADDHDGSGGNGGSGGGGGGSGERSSRSPKRRDRSKSYSKSRSRSPTK
jgi:splicing factor U2AF subunit